MKEYLRYAPLGRGGSRKEMGHVALFLVSEAASYITGETVVADGGTWMGGMENSMEMAAARLQHAQHQVAQTKQSRI